MKNFSSATMATTADHEEAFALAVDDDLMDRFEDDSRHSGDESADGSHFLQEEEKSEESSTFEKKYEIVDEEAVSLQRVYVLHMDAIFDGADSMSVVVGLSDYRVVVYDVGVSNFGSIFSNSGAHRDAITDVKFFAADDKRKFLSGSLDGCVKLWDTRVGAEQPALVFRDDSDGVGKAKPISCFDVSCDNKFVCGGTPVLEADSYLLFWDSRKSSVLGGYWETHTDDVTQVRFDASRSNWMMSGSVDGLVNVFDVSRNNEEDALMNTLNVDTAIRKLRWLHSGTSTTDMLCGCLTDMETLQMWNVDEADLLRTFDRRALAEAINTPSSCDDVYVCDVYASGDSDSDALVLSGSNVGKGDRLRLAKFQNGDELRAYANFEGNKQLVRCGCYDSKRDTFVTGGESGIVSVWRPPQQQQQQLRRRQDATCLKERVRKNNKKRKTAYA